MNEKEKCQRPIFSSEWTEDLSKTRLRRSMALKSRRTEKDGVRFPGDFSYSALTTGNMI